MVSWRPPRALRKAEPNRPLAPPPTKIASYRPSSSGLATFHRPSVLSAGWSTMSSISSAHSPTVSGAPSAPRGRPRPGRPRSTGPRCCPPGGRRCRRSAAPTRPRSAGRRPRRGHRRPSGPSAWIRARSDLNPSPGFRTSIIADPSLPVACRPVQHRQRRRAGGRSPGDEERAGRRPARSGGCAGRAARGPGRSSSPASQRSSRRACRVPQARVASCRLKWTSGSFSSRPVSSRIRCSRYFSVLLCTDSSAAVAS